MREQLKLLENLQQVDVQLEVKKQALTSLPAKLKSLKEDVDRVELLLDKERQQLEESQRLRAELDGGIKSNQDMMTKSKNKLGQVRNSKEFMATQRELEVTRKTTLDREEELAKLMAAIETSQESIKVHEEEVGALKRLVDEEEKETSAKVAELQGEVEVGQAARDKMTKGIRKDLLARYDHIRRAAGDAVVPARSGVCTGCDMMLPPQLFNILQRGDSVETCPSCRRIVYFEGLEE